VEWRAGDQQALMGDSRTPLTDCPQPSTRLAKIGRSDPLVDS